MPGRWELFAVTRPDVQPATDRTDASLATALDRAVLNGVRRAPALSRAIVRLGNAVERRRVRAR